MTVTERDSLLSGRENREHVRDCVGDRRSVIEDDSKDRYADPREWSASYKWSIVGLLSFLAFNVTFTCIAVVPIADSVVLDLGNGSFNKSASVLLVTIWELGEAAGPLLFAPLSEIFGRYIVLNSANAIFVLATIAAASSKTAPVFIIARALGGFAVASSVLNPSIIADMFAPEQRGSALAFVMMTPLVGCAAGPVIGGAVGERFGWRQVVWICVALASICQILLLTCFKETRRACAEAQVMEASEKALDSFWVSATRPIRVLCSSSVLTLLCIYHAIAFVVYYIMAVTLADILKDVYGQSTTVAGSSFLFFTAGTAVSLALCKLTIDRYYRYLREHNGGVAQAEFWLPWTIGGSLALPAAVMLYGWSAQLHLPLPVFLLSLVLLGMSLSLTSLPMFAYIVEAYGSYSASATAGIIVTRCLAGVFMPLLVAPLIRSSGYGWTFTLVAATCACVAPIPALIMRYGQVWRQRSTYTRTE